MMVKLLQHTRPVHLPRWGRKNAFGKPQATPLALATPPFPAVIKQLRMRALVWNRRSQFEIQLGETNTSAPQSYLAVTAVKVQNLGVVDTGCQKNH